MQACFNLLMLICLIVPVSFAGADTPREASTEAEQTTAHSFPYVAEITGDNVFVRSGPGTNYYRCGRMNKGDRVKVVDSSFSWSRIVPPEGSFSWISKQYVTIDPNDPVNGVVNSDNVRVWAGSPFLKPIYSTRKQLSLNKSEKVKLLDGQSEDYYRIIPPSGAYLWISSEYTRPLGAIGQVPISRHEQTEPENKTAQTLMVSISVESRKLSEYQVLEKKIQAETKKPLEKQNYKPLKLALEKIAENKQAGKAARYAGFAIGKIGRFQLALNAGKKLELQDEQLTRIEEKIEKARLDKLTRLEDLGRFAAVGTFQTSSVYDEQESLQRYRLVDENGKILCYATPEAAVSQTNLEKFVGHKIGLTGTILPHPQTSSAIVKFTGIVELN